MLLALTKEAGRLVAGRWMPGSGSGTGRCPGAALEQWVSAGGRCWGAAGRWKRGRSCRWMVEGDAGVRAVRLLLA